MIDMTPYNEMTEAARAGTDLAEVVGYSEWFSGNSPLLAAYLSAHRTMINGSALCAALAVTERD